MASMSPRSILKHSSSRADHPAQLVDALPYPPPPPQVHFPPTPTLTKTYPTHSVSAYDRAPIVVLPNDCALPERGCPGRTYSTSPCKSKRSGSSCHSKSHSSGYTGIDGRKSSSNVPSSASASAFPSSRPPPLIPDISSSESDESDGVASPPLEFAEEGATIQKCLYSYAQKMPVTPPLQEQLDKALSFLPYPPSPPSPKDAQKRDRERRRKHHDSSKRNKSEQCSSFATSSLDGCLGGF